MLLDNEKKKEGQRKQRVERVRKNLLRAPD